VTYPGRDLSTVTRNPILLEYMTQAALQARPAAGHADSDAGTASSGGGDGEGDRDGGAGSGDGGGSGSEDDSGGENPAAAAAAGGGGGGAGVEDGIVFIDSAPARPAQPAGRRTDSPAPGGSRERGAGEAAERSGGSGGSGGAGRGRGFAVALRRVTGALSQVNILNALVITDSASHH
jgi:hypothetical protein